MKTLKLPFIVKVFEKHIDIDSWSSVEGTIYMKPKKAAFSHLILRSKRSFFFETKWHITVLYDAVDELSMDDLCQTLYRRLKNMECILESKGFLGRNKYFRPNNKLNELRFFIPEIEVSDELSRILNEKEEVMGLVRSILPDKMTITLHSMPVKYKPASTEAVMRGTAAFYRKPTQITWIITLTRGFSRGPGVTRKADQIIQLLDQIIGVLSKKMGDLRAC